LTGIGRKGIQPIQQYNAGGGAARHRRAWKNGWLKNPGKTEHCYLGLKYGGTADIPRVGTKVSAKKLLLGPKSYRINDRYNGKQTRSTGESSTRIEAQQEKKGHGGEAQNHSRPWHGNAASITDGKKNEAKINKR